ncbi:MAG: sulfotransferase domain-containing protein [Planctomycetes bacterium]|nr:sulfotransferase domain-containing protein [Planctomycetota bacterium]
MTTTARSLVLAAKAANDAHDFRRGAELARQAVALDPTQGYIIAELAHSLTHRHDYWLNPAFEKQLVADGTLAEAVRLYERAFELGHHCEFSRLCCGHALTSLGRTAEAARHLRVATDIRALQVHPELKGSYEAAPVRGPDFLIVGTTKAGTTSLYEYMCQHPRVLPAIWKEPEYYLFPERGMDWYLSHFPRTPDRPARFVTGEASSCYLSIWNAKDLIHASFPAARLFVLLRDPVDKAISHCHHDRKIGREQRTVDQALNEELDILEPRPDPFHGAEEYWRTQSGYVWLGLYAYMLENWFSKFPREQMLVVQSEQFWREPGPIMDQAFAHVGLPAHALGNYPVHLEGKYDKSKPEPVRVRLQRFFARHNDRLFDLVGRRFDWQQP